MGYIKMITSTLQQDKISMLGRSYPTNGIAQPAEYSFPKVTPQQVVEIRSLNGKKRAQEVAPLFGITARSVHYIWSGKTWGRI